MLYPLSVLAVAVSLAAIPPTRAADHQVVVGGPGILQFNPNVINAPVGDTVTFTFKQKNHTATQSTFANPCVQSQGGFDTGFIPVPDNNTAGPFQQAQFTIEDANPVWVFCRQANHCQQGMVFAINPGEKFAAFQAAAMGNSTSSAPPASSTSTSAAVSSTDASATSVTPPAATSTPAPGSTTQDHRIVVGGTGVLLFTPANITAQPGDTITFEFHQKNHTATQSSFAAPCRKLADTSASGQVGFDSGFMPVADGSVAFPTYTIQVNDTAPIWAYCAQATHCGSGMVFAANAIESGPNTFEAFEARAKQINGTAASNSTSGSTNGAVRLNNVNRDAGVALALVGLTLGLML
ncbi:hypothetical protein FA95DRAFT_1531048 [Auriscalpium vulgare]|uniref:Uncharacterized protein n=1 Tax=Auriscalpium vulgare TaxID=40419 RepID=A0ACB8SAZ8_9AGAM|nr:hypothetical protein FA95DRAFT_1531048 [Auriscalpium vulgare]